MVASELTPINRASTDSTAASQVATNLLSNGCFDFNVTLGIER